MDIERLHYMANQIAANFAVQGEDKAIASTASHLTAFWDPRMIAQIVSSDRAGLSPVALAAVEAVAQQAESGQA